MGKYEGPSPTFAIKSLAGSGDHAGGEGGAAK